MPERVQFGSDAEDYVTRKDFEGAMDVHPVSDPNIFSEAQRFAQTQAVIQAITQMAPVAPQVVQMHNLHALFKRMYEQMKFPDYQEILPDVPTAIPSNPVDENIDLVMGKPVKAFEGQDHQAHIQVHCDFAQSPFLGLSAAMSPNYMAAALNHLQDHLLVFYAELMKQDAGVPAGAPPGMDNSPQVAEALAKASATVAQAMKMAFEKIPPLMQQAAAHVKANAPKPQDPMAAVAMQDVQNRHEIAQGKLTLDQQKQGGEQQAKVMDLRQRAMEAQQQYELAVNKLRTESEMDMASAGIKAHTELEKAAGNNETAVEIAEMKIASDEKTQLKDGATLSKE